MSQPNQSNTIDADGNPADYFVYSVNEKINVGNYSSVDTFVSVGRTIPDSDEARQDVIDIVEKLAEVKRDEVIALITTS